MNTFEQISRHKFDVLAANTWNEVSLKVDCPKTLRFVVSHGKQDRMVANEFGLKAAGVNICLILEKHKCPLYLLTCLINPVKNRTNETSYCEKPLVCKSSTFVLFWCWCYKNFVLVLPFSSSTCSLYNCFTTVLIDGSNIQRLKIVCDGD